MQINRDEYFNEIAKGSSSIVMLISPLGKDAVASGIALALYIENKWNKKVSIIYSGDFKQVDPRLIEVHDVLSGIGTATLKMTIDYAGTQIKSVDYYEEDNSKLVLKIKPVSSNFSVDDRIKFDVEGSQFDLIITIGAQKLESLKEILGKDEEDLSAVSIVNIDRSQNNQNFGKVNIIDLEADSMISLIMKKFAEWGYTPSKEVARVLLLGLS